MPVALFEFATMVIILIVMTTQVLIPAFRGTAMDLLTAKAASDLGVMLKPAPVK